MPFYRSWFMPRVGFSVHIFTDGYTFIIMKLIVEGVIFFKIQCFSESLLCKPISSYVSLITTFSNSLWWIERWSEVFFKFFFKCFSSFLGRVSNSIMLLLETLVNKMYVTLIRMLGSTAELNHLVNAMSWEVLSIYVQRVSFSKLNIYGEF